VKPVAPTVAPTEPVDHSDGVDWVTRLRIRGSGELAGFEKRAARRKGPESEEGDSVNFGG